MVTVGSPFHVLRRDLRDLEPTESETPYLTASICSRCSANIRSVHISPSSVAGATFALRISEYSSMSDRYRRFESLPSSSSSRTSKTAVANWVS